MRLNPCRPTNHKEPVAEPYVKEGDKWELYIPADIGYGGRGSPPKIKPGAVLIFEMKIERVLYM